MKFVLALFVGMTSAAVDAAAPRIPADDLRRLQLAEPALILVDVRDSRAFAAGHIQGARNVPAPDILSANLPQTGPVVVYCGEDPCPLTTGAAEKLTSYGYKDVSILEGGFGAWLAKKYPAEISHAQAVSHTREEKTDEIRRIIESGEAVVLDLRNPKQFSLGHLPGARSVPLEELDQATAWLPKDKDIVVYDVASARSKQAARKLTAAGFKVRELSGGVAGWVRKGLPLEIK